MDSIESNLDQINELFDKLADGFTFTTPGIDKSLGHDLIGKAAEGIIERSIVDDTDPAGGMWLANAAEYAARKVRKLGVVEVGVLSGQMLSMQEVRGKEVIGPDEATMEYGSGAPGIVPPGWGPDTSKRKRKRRGKRGGKQRRRRRRKKTPPPTPRQKAEWFEAGGREFWGLDDTIVESMNEVVGEVLGRFIEDANT